LSGKSLLSVRLEKKVRKSLPLKKKVLPLQPVPEGRPLKRKKLIEMLENKYKTSTTKYLSLGKERDVDSRKVVGREQII